MPNLMAGTEKEKVKAHLSDCKELLDLFLKERLDGIALWVGALWQEEGECSTQFFFNSLSERTRKRHIPSLRDPDTNLLATLPTEMIATATKFYSTLYTPTPSCPTATTLLIQNLTHTIPLQEQHNTDLITKLSTTNLENLLKHTPKRRSPGKDGLPFEIYPLILSNNTICDLFINVINDSLTLGTIPPSWLEMIMILLFKKGDPSELTNWQPLSLINCDAKLFTKLLTNQLRPLLPQLIHPGQTGFIKGRLIADNGLVLSTIMDHCKEIKGQQVGIMLDFEKAYDRVNPDYLVAVMSKMGFTPQFINTIHNLFFNTQIHLNINGHITPSFTQHRGL